MRRRYYVIALDAPDGTTDGEARKAINAALQAGGSDAQVVKRVAAAPDGIYRDWDTRKGGGK